MIKNFPLRVEMGVSSNETGEVINQAVELIDFAGSVDDLGNLLAQYGIDVSLWGKGDAKTVKDLYQELQSGEADLVLLSGRKSELFRRTIVALINIFYKDTNGGLWVLKESKQVFNDGRQRVRDLRASLSEKVQSQENVVDAACRGIHEELDIVIDPQRLEFKGTQLEIKESQSYPNLLTCYVMEEFGLTLTSDEYKPKYEENDGKKITIWEWQRLES